MHAIPFCSASQLAARFGARIRHAEPQRNAKRPQHRARAERRIQQSTDAIKVVLYGPGLHVGVEL